MRNNFETSRFGDTRLFRTEDSNGESTGADRTELPVTRERLGHGGLWVVKAGNCPFSTGDMRPKEAGAPYQTHPGWCSADDGYRWASVSSCTAQRLPEVQRPGCDLDERGPKKMDRKSAFWGELHQRIAGSTRALTSIGRYQKVRNKILHGTNRWRESAEYVNRVKSPFFSQICKVPRSNVFFGVVFPRWI